MRSFNAALPLSNHNGDTIRKHSEFFSFCMTSTKTLRFLSLKIPQKELIIFCRPSKCKFIRKELLHRWFSKTLLKFPVKLFKLYVEGISWHSVNTTSTKHNIFKVINIEKRTKVYYCTRISILNLEPSLQFL